MKEFKLQHTIEEHWAKLSKLEQAEHVLQNSELYQLYRNGVQLRKQVEEMNKNVDEEFHVRIPTMYYVDQNLDPRDK